MERACRLVQGFWVTSTNHRLEITDDLVYWPYGVPSKLLIFHDPRTGLISAQLNHNDGKKYREYADDHETIAETNASEYKSRHPHHKK